MKTIINENTNEIIIKNSRFIGVVIPINDINEVKNNINRIKNIYKDATHYPYAYIIDNYKKSSDDGEPGGTAGIPILQVLEKNNLNYILVIVIRYFGGIKLGAGGLVRAYTKCVTELLNNSNIKELELGYNIKITFDYTYQKQIDYILKDINIIDKEYDTNITYIFDCNKELLDKLNTINNIKITVISNKYI